ncbi:CGNR zinc finger domain-containing protein [Streptomyces sp. NPDC059373]
METVRFRQGAGRLCLDFIRTLRYRGTASPTEELGDAHALADWVRQCGPCGADSAVPLPAEVDVEETHVLREAIHDLISAVREGGEAGSCGRGAREEINRAAAGEVPVPRLEASGSIQWRADDPVRATLALVARDALDLVTSPAVTRLRNCAGPDCGAIFLDNSRPGTRRWCSMDTCGNRAKKETLRSKTASSGH